MIAQKAPMLQFSNITLKIVGRPLINEASVTIPGGSKCGFVGKNGTGKSTLFSAIAGRLGLESGDISIPKGMRLGEVHQEVPGNDDPLIEIVVAADLELNALMQESKTTSDPDRIGEIQARLVDIDAHSAEARAASILAGLGFDNEAQMRPAREFSGGWRMRVALAAVLFSNPDVLLLDEPTNYLDLEGTLWLENFIARYRGTVLIISHDRDLLNSSVNSILHLSDHKLTFYRGNYDQFERQRAETALLQEKAKTKQDAQISHMQAYIDRFRAKASKAKQAQSRLKALEKLKPIAMIVNERTAPINFPSPERQLSSPIIKLDGVSAGYGEDSIILSKLDLRIDQDDRIALLGSNGNGKSTFAKLLADRLPLVKGDYVKAGNLKIAMFAQHQLDDLDPEGTAVDHVRPLMPSLPMAKVRSRVAQMGLGAERMDTKAKNLSGGEKARLLLGLVTFDRPHVLILDEPTNHLDIDSRTALTDALNSYEGAVILISHDRYLIETSVDRLWLVRDGTVTPYDNDIEAYRGEILKREKPSASSKPKKEVDTPPPPVEKRKTAVRRREDLKPMKVQITKLEKVMGELQDKIALADTKLQDAKLFARNPAMGAKLAQRRAELAFQLEERELQWLALSEEYDAAIEG